MTVCMKRLLSILLSCLFCAGAMCQGQDYAALVREGMAALERDSLSRAEQLFLSAIAAKPLEHTNVVLYQYIGKVRTRTQRLDEAMEAYDTALKLEPSSQELLMDRASLHIQRGDMARALTDLTDLLTLNPDHDEALFFRAYIYAAQRLNSKARIDYERLLTARPTHRRARLGLALLCDNDNRPREAMEHMDVLLRYWPDDAAAYAVRGGMYQKRRQYEEALKDMDRAIELEPENADFYVSRALLHKATHKSAHGKGRLHPRHRVGSLARGMCRNDVG